jgi:hypothetical protein
MRLEYNKLYEISLYAPFPNIFYCSTTKVSDFLKFKPYVSHVTSRRPCMHVRDIFHQSNGSHYLSLTLALIKIAAVLLS